ncbi:arylsulfotransferase family protein [Sinomonas sp. ASV486]|uniref:arylsulfotransferase family protein n=1 Tax=Sinomonas sp. ASV486 TaxID=3051170 RepID=UPI0027DDE575|nr:arylsulfotransferase family protein [Sinomonas sp. ASV486]MDQ4491399.1 arylsulfotransferase family protein [Sinomonas sp. ASV486]
MIKVSRRHFIQGAGLAVVGAVAGAGVARSSIFPLPPSAAAASTPTPSASASAGTAGIPDRTFTSTKLTAPHVSVWTDASTAAGLLFTGPMGHGTNGLIMDNTGAPVWMEPTGVGVTDLRVQTYRGQPVLTYWSGKGIGGHGEGVGVIKDTAYRTVAQLSAGAGLKADLHEFTLTQAGTALMTSYPTVKADLSSVGGPASGYMYDCHVQEVDIATGALLFDWTASAHIPLSESFVKPSDDAAANGTTSDKAFDPFHINSVDRRPDGYLVSARHTHTAYLVGQGGDIMWRLGGSRSDFTIPADAAFAWQHDVRQRSGGVVSMFDNHYKDGTTGTSRGLILNVDEAARTVTLKLALERGGHRGNAMGNVQFLDNGHYMVGWGSDPAATEFAADGTAVSEATGIGGGCYRAYRHAWSATPTTPPDVAVVQGNGSTMQAFASWNGATEVASWRFLAGDDAEALAEAAVVKKRGFETTAAVAAAGHVAVQALDVKGNVLATSAVIAA